MCGTGGEANTFPGAVAPFGMIQWSPDTEAGERSGGYYDQDKRISGFSVIHLSGAGCGYGEDFAFSPILGELANSPATNRTAFAASFKHDHESAKPGFYSVILDNSIKVELTTSTRCGCGQFTFPAGKTATMVINAASDINGTISSAINISPAQQSLSGWTKGGHFCGGRDETTLYFYAVFDRSFSAYGTWSGDALARRGEAGSGKSAGAYLGFDTSKNRTVRVKVALSYVSVENAIENLKAEMSGSKFAKKEFEKIADRAGSTWKTLLNRIQVSGTNVDNLQTFYSMLYHALLAPTVCADENGQYMGFDGKIHPGEGHTQYANFSGWDIYRSECQLLALITPERASDMAQSLLEDYLQGGAFPRWGVAGGDTGIMMGDPAAPMIAGFYAFGATNFAARAALAGLVNAATNPAVKAPRTRTYERDALRDYLGLGYVPEHQRGGYGNVSMTLEYCSADFALSQFALALGDESDSELCLKHAQNWRNLFNPDTHDIQMRRSNGTWAPAFTNNADSYDKALAYVEGTAEQYVWMVPFNYAELFELMGGKEETAARLDKFFTKINDGWNSEYAWLGNEPCLETPWIYCFLGQSYKTQAIVNQAMTTLYSHSDSGYPGNDDLGQMSSWYVFSALGMYPELPGSDILVLTTPLFPKAVLHLENGDVTITGNGEGYALPYVQGLSLNGTSWDQPWVRFKDVRHGASICYKLGSTANINWGSGKADAPPSYSGANTTPISPLKP